MYAICRARCIRSFFNFFAKRQRNDVRRCALACLQGCSVAGVTENVCGEELCIPGSDGYICGKRIIVALLRRETYLIFTPPVEGTSLSSRRRAF